MNNRTTTTENEENLTVTIEGEEYLFKGVTDLEVFPLAKIFGTKQPEEGTVEYAKWQQEFIDRFTDHPAQRAVAMFMRCAFPDIPERIVKYTVRRLPDGTEECRPGIDLRVRLSATEFKQIVLIITSELEKIEQKLNQEQVSHTKGFGSQALKTVVTKRPKPAHFVLHGADIEQEKISSNQGNNSEEIASIVAEVLKQRQLPN